MEADAQLEGALAAEVSLAVVDVLEGIVSVVQQADTLQPVLAHVLRVLLHCLAVNQSAAVLTHMLATQRAIVSKVREYDRNCVIEMNVERQSMLNCDGSFVDTV